MSVHHSLSLLSRLVSRKKYKIMKKNSKYVFSVSLFETGHQMLDWRSVGCVMASWIFCDDFSEQTLSVITTCELLIYCWPLEMNKIRCRTLRVCVHSAVRCWDSAEMPELTNQLLMRADPLLSWPRCQTLKEMLFWSISSEGKHRSSTMEVSNSQKLTVDLVERESDWCIVAYQTSIWFEATQCWTV